MLVNVSSLNNDVSGTFQAWGNASPGRETYTRQVGSDYCSMTALKNRRKSKGVSRIRVGKTKLSEDKLAWSYLRVLAGIQA